MRSWTLHALFDLFLRGEEEGQVQNKQFKELLGNKGAITEMVRKYEGCLVAYSEGAEAEAEYGLRIGKERREFFKASKSLRSFIFDESDRYRQIKFKVMNPKESFAELKELLTESSSGIGIYKDFPNCEFSINRGLPGESRHRIEGNVMGKSSIDLVWKADERLDIGKVPKAGFYVIHQADSKRVQNVPLAKRLNPEDVGCYGERENAGKDRPIDEIELKFEAHGFWSFVLFLEVYGFPRSEDLGTEGDRKIWWVRATLPPIKTASGISTGDSRVESYEPVAYLKVLLNDKALDPLPDWASVSKTE